MAINVITEEIAENFEEAAEVTRKISGAGVGYFLFGVVVGGAIGAWYTYRYSKEKLRSEAFVESKAEVEKIREAYRIRSAIQDKPATPADVVKSQGYSVEEQPEGERVIVAHQAHALKAEGKTDTEIMEELGVSDRTLEILLASPAPERPLKPPVPVREDPIQYHRAPPPLKAPREVREIPWNFEEELGKRKELDADDPYVIHQDEYHETEDGRPRPGWSQAAFAYYTRDDVLTDELDGVIQNAEDIIGRYNLRFGDGSDDPDVVFIRNPERMMEMEITRVDQSYEEHVLGLEHNDEG